MIRVPSDRTGCEHAFLLGANESPIIYAPGGWVYTAAVGSVLASLRVLGRQAGGSGGARWSRRPWGARFSLRTHWPNYSREASLTLDSRRPRGSWEPVVTRGAHVTFLALLATWSRQTERPFHSFEPRCPSTATGPWLTCLAFGPNRALLSCRTSNSQGPLVPFAASQSYWPFGTRLASVPFGPRWSRSACCQTTRG